MLGPLNIPAGKTWNIFFEAYPKKVQADGSIATDFTYYTMALWQHFNVGPGGREGCHLTLGLASQKATITGRAMRNGVPWTDKIVRFWGNPDDSDTGADFTQKTDSNGYFTGRVKGFYIDTPGARHEPCTYRVYVRNSSNVNHLLGSWSVSPGQNINIGTFEVP